jgi:hypothetical protein
MVIALTTRLISGAASTTTGSIAIQAIAQVTSQSRIHATLKTVIRAVAMAVATPVVTAA